MVQTGQQYLQAFRFGYPILPTLPPDSADGTNNAPADGSTTPTVAQVQGLFDGTQTITVTYHVDVAISEESGYGTGSGSTDFTFTCDLLALNLYPLPTEVGWLTLPQNNVNITGGTTFQSHVTNPDGTPGGSRTWNITTSNRANFVSIFAARAQVGGRMWIAIGGFMGASTGLLNNSYGAFFTGDFAAWARTLGSSDDFTDDGDDAGTMIGVSLKTKYDNSSTYLYAPDDASNNGVTITISKLTVTVGK